MTTYIVQADSKVSRALIAIFKALNVNFEVLKKNNKEGDSPYDPEFVKKVLRARGEKGGKTIDPYNLWESLKLS